MANEMILPDENSKILDVDRTSDTINVPAILTYLAQFANMASIANGIKKGIQYVVEVPADLRAGLESGALEMLHGEESGKTWATVVKKVANGKKEFVANCPITEQAFYQGNPLQEMSSGVISMQLQQQIAELRQIAEDTFETVQRIEQGQRDDREGELLSGRADIVLALMEPDEEARKRQMELARSKISTAQAKIGKTLKSLAESYTCIPKSQWGRFIKEFFRHGYLKQRDTDFDRIEDYYQLYLQATQLHAGAYAIVGDLTRAERVYDNAMKYIGSISFQNLSTFSNMYRNQDTDDLFFNHATEYFETEKVECIEAARPYEYIAISLSGEELLEAMENGR